MTSDRPLDLGAFSVSLTVSDLAASRSFYEKLGFRVIGGEADEGWLILRSGASTIGLFHDMFERNILTFNPGWDAENQPSEDYTDVRELQRELAARGIESSSTSTCRRRPRADSEPGHLLPAHTL